MSRAMKRPRAWVGVSQSGASAILVTLTSDGALLDRREATLIDAGMTSHPHHHEGSWAVGRYLDTPGAVRLTLPEAVRLVEQVRATALRRAHEALVALAGALTIPVAGLALRECPPLPATIEQRILDHRAQTQADSVMYRQALADAARGLGWTVRWFGERRLAREAATGLGVSARQLTARLSEMGRSAGPPWRARHKEAAMAALAT